MSEPGDRIESSLSLYLIVPCRFRLTGKEQITSHLNSTKRSNSRATNLRGSTHTANTATPCPATETGSTWAGTDDGHRPARHVRPGAPPHHRDVGAERRSHLRLWCR